MKIKIVFLALLLILGGRAYSGADLNLNGVITEVGYDDE